MSLGKLLLNYDKYLILPGKIRLVLAENIALRIRLAVTFKCSAFTYNKKLVVFTANSHNTAIPDLMQLCRKNKDS